MSEIASAMPTKSFFIDTLVRDVTVFDAIFDLIDNAVDGAKRIRGNSTYGGLAIDLTLQKDFFQIHDNCGGINADTAKKYAFRFGKTENDGEDRVDGSIGGFGVGMKRAIFKIGSYFEVDCVEKKSSFSLKVDLNEWQKDDKTWVFNFENWNNEESYSEADTYTHIAVHNLHNESSSELSKSNVINILSAHIKKKHAESLGNGLKITINGIDVHMADAFQLLSSEFITPIYRTFSLSDDQVGVVLYAGISDNDFHKCGWYISCNHRLVVEADKSENTGWGFKARSEDEEGEADTAENAIPKAHKQFGRFRGFISFNSTDSTLLPWNTAKTDINYEAEIYKKIKPEMIGIMRNIIDFLNAVDKEFDYTDKPLTNEITKATSIPLKSITANTTVFTWREHAAKLLPKEKLATISYKVKEDDIVIAKSLLGVTLNKDVGEKTFEYFLTQEQE